MLLSSLLGKLGGGWEKLYNEAKKQLTLLKGKYDEAHKSRLQFMRAASLADQKLRGYQSVTAGDVIAGLGPRLDPALSATKNIPNDIKNITETVTKSFAETNKNVKKLESLIGDATETFAVNLTYVKKILNNNGLWAN